MDLQAVQAEFTTRLPLIRLNAVKRFHPGRSGLDEEEYVAEVVALSWRSWLQCVRDGKRPSEFATVLVAYNCSAVNCGRRMGRGRARSDVSNPAAQRRGGFKVQMLRTPVCSTYVERTVYDVVDSHTATAAEQALARLCFAEWSAPLSTRQLAVLGKALAGEGTAEIAHALAVTAGAVSQHRRALHTSFLDYLRGE